MTTSLLLITLSDIDHYDVDDGVMIMTHSVIRNSNHHYQVATSYFFQEELFALFCNDALPKKIVFYMP